jgi:glucose-1-phosphate thymidylyltransferase
VRDSVKGLPVGVILNAGLGTRLRPITPALPKALVPVMNRPLIDYGVELRQDLGITEIAVVVSPGDDATLARAREIAAPGVVVHVAEQAEPRGIGDAAITPGALLDGRDVVVLAADTLLIGDRRDYATSFAASGAVAGLVLAAVDDPRAFGVAVLEGDRVTDLEEKPEQPRSNLALVGLWLLAPAVVERLRAAPVMNANGEADLTRTIAAMVGEGALVKGWQTEGRWLDAGTLEGLLDAHTQLLATLAPAGRVDGDCRVSGAVSAASGASARRSLLLGPVLLGDDSVIEDSDVGGSVVGMGATIRRCQLDRCVVLPGARLDGGSYRDVVITASGEIGGPGAVPTTVGARRERTA